MNPSSQPDQPLIDPYLYSQDLLTIINNFGEKNEGIWKDLETTYSSKRIAQLRINPIQILSCESIKTTHGYIFQDIYEWAGEERTINMTKAGRPYLPKEAFDNGKTWTEIWIQKIIETPFGNKDLFIENLANFLDSANNLHMFREGNTRTLRECVRSLSLEKGCVIDLNPWKGNEAQSKYRTIVNAANIPNLKELLYASIASEFNAPLKTTFQNPMEANAKIYLTKLAYKTSFLDAEPARQEFFFESIKKAKAAGIATKFLPMLLAKELVNIAEISGIKANALVSVCEEAVGLKSQRPAKKSPKAAKKPKSKK
jgi:cell filamentation protein